MKFLYPLIIACLFLLIPVIGYLLLGSMVTHKYQVDHGRIFIEMDANKVSPEQTKKDHAAVDQLEKEIIHTQVALVVSALLCFLVAIGMVIFRYRKSKQ